MKVIFAGFPKCGTKSMNAALRILGYKVYDYEDNFFYLGDEWMKTLSRGDTKEGFYNMYKDVDASCDGPFCYFWEKILEAFPDAKIILTKRNNEEEWLRSWERQTKSMEDNWFLAAHTFFSPTAYKMFEFNRFVARIVFSAPPQPFWANYRGISPAVSKKRYRDHNMSVLQKAPKDQLLVFSLSEGWGPLCQFLGKPVPSIEFPHENRRATLLDDFMKNSSVYQRMKMEALLSLSLLSILGMTTCFYLYRYPPKSTFHRFIVSRFFQLFSRGSITSD